MDPLACGFTHVQEIMFSFIFQQFLFWGVVVGAEWQTFLVKTSTSFFFFGGGGRVGGELRESVTFKLHQLKLFTVHYHPDTK